MRRIDWFMVIPSTFIGVMLLWLVYLFSLLPTILSTEKRCLELGYPDYTVTFDYTGYCLNIDGAVTGIVEELE